MKRHFSYFIVSVASCFFVIQLAQLGHGETNSSQNNILKKAIIDGNGEGWRTLNGEDFVNVNCAADTWQWKGSHAFCTGKPVGVIRMKETIKNFELVCEWMHKKDGGNSGVFVWASPASIKNL